MATAQPRRKLTGEYPSAGQRGIRCHLQFATPTTDGMGGRTEPIWQEFGTWWAQVTVLPIIPNETEAVLLYQVEGPYRKPIVDKFNTGKGVRIVTETLTLKVFQLENPDLKNRTLVAHCANTVKT